jgi:hypothetical protein
MGSPSAACSSSRKKWLFVVDLLGHGAPSFPNDQSIACYFSVLARNRTWSASFAGSRANPAHSGDMVLSFSTPPRNRTSSGRFEVCHAVHHTRRASFVSQYPDLDLNQGLDLRRVQCYPLHHRDMFSFQRPNLDSNQDQNLRTVLCCPLHHRDVLPTKSRRLDSHQHEPVYKTGAFLSRATSAQSTSARSRTPSASFGGWLLSQEHTRVG